MNLLSKIFQKIEVSYKFNNCFNLKLSNQITHSFRIKNNLNPKKADNKISYDKTIFKTQRNTNKKNEKIRKSLNISNYSSNNLLRKRNSFLDNKIRTKSIDHKINNVLETQNKSLIKSGIFDNINIKNYIDTKMNERYRKNKLTINNTETKLNSLIKVNVKKRKEKYVSSKNNIYKKNKIFNDYKMRAKTEINQKNISEASHKNKNSNSSDNHFYNLVSQEKLYNNKIKEIKLIQNFWRKYLSLHRNIDNKNYLNVIYKTKTKKFFIKVKIVLYSHLLKLLKYMIYNINFYLKNWHNKIYLEKILQNIISIKRQNCYKNITIKIPNFSKNRTHKTSTRQISSGFNRFKKLKTYYDNCSNISNNLSSTENFLKNKNNNFIHKTSLLSSSNLNSSRRVHVYNKSSEKENNKNRRNIFIAKINKKTKTKSNLSELLFRNNDNFSKSINKINTSANKDLNIKKKFTKILVSNNKITTNFDKDKIRNKFKSLKTNSEKNKKLVQNSKNDNDKNINKKIRNCVLFHKNENNNKNNSKINNNINQVVKNKNKSHRLKKFDTCPLSVMKKNGENQLIYKSRIKKYLFHWKSITFKTKIMKYLRSIWNKKKLRNIIYRKILRIIMDYFQILILKKYFDEYQNKAIKTNILLKLRAYLLKSNKLQKFIDSTEKENLEHYNTKGGDIINNININNFINYNCSTQIISSDKNNIGWNNYIQENNFKFPLSHMKNETMNFINTNNQFKQEKNYKIVKINNFYPKGILIDQMNQLRMVFNLVQQKKSKKSNIKEYFKLWKKNTFNNCKNMTNFKKINILEKQIRFDHNRNIIINNKKISSTTNIIRKNDINNEIIKPNFQNKKTIRFINRINNKNANDNSSESFNIRNTFNNEIIYTKKILNHNKILSNNYYRYNNNVLKMGQTFRKTNKIEEMEIHFNSLSINKCNSFTRNTINENSFNNSDKLTETAKKKGISKIRIDFMDNLIQKREKENNNNYYDNIFQNIKKYFSIINRKIDYKNSNQTFCCRMKKFFDEI